MHGTVLGSLHGYIMVFYVVAETCVMVCGRRNNTLNPASPNSVGPRGQPSTEPVDAMSVLLQV